MQRGARIEDDDRLAGLWVRPGTDPIFDAPVTLAAGALALCHVALTSTDDRQRATRWAVYGRSGVLLEGALEPAAVASWQVLADVERALGDAGIRLTGGAGQGRLPLE